MMMFKLAASRNALPVNEVVDHNTRGELLWLVPLAIMFALLVTIAELLSYFNGTSAIAMIAGYGGKALRLLPLVASIGVICQFGIAITRDYRTALDQVIAQWRAALGDPFMLAACIVPILMLPFCSSRSAS
jgi:hypothetical protein